MKLLVLDRTQYFRGQITLFIGDQWYLTGRVVERIGGVDQDVNLTSAAVTGYFPAAAGGASGFVAVVEDAICGKISIPVSPTQSAGLLTSPQPISVYAAVSGTSDGPYSVSTSDDVLVIASPGFSDPY